jgi:hypothetical protein
LIAKGTESANSIVLQATLSLPTSHFMGEEAEGALRSATDDERHLS